MDCHTRILIIVNTECNIENGPGYGLMCFIGILNLYAKKTIATAQRMPSGTKDTWGNKPHFKQDDLYVIPKQLICEIFESIPLSATEKHGWSRKDWFITEHLPL